MSVAAVTVTATPASARSGRSAVAGLCPSMTSAAVCSPDLVDEVDGPHGAVVVGVPVFGEFDVGGAVVVAHACADGQACACGVHVDAEAHDAAWTAFVDGGFLPLSAVDGAAEGVFVPDAEGFAPEVVAGEVFPQVGDGFVAGVGRVAGVGFPPLVAVERVGVAVGGVFDVEGAVGAAGARFVPEAGECFAVVPWPGRGAHVDGLWVVGAVLGRQHRRHRRVGQVLGLVDDEQGDLLDAAQCSAFSGAEEDTRPVAEAYLLFAGGEADAVVGVHEAAHLRPEHDRAHAFERVLDDAEVLRRPHDAHAGGFGRRGGSRPSRCRRSCRSGAGSTARRCGRSRSRRRFSRG